MGPLILAAEEAEGLAGQAAEAEGLPIGCLDSCEGDSLGTGSPAPQSDRRQQSSSREDTAGQEGQAWWMWGEGRTAVPACRESSRSYPVSLAQDHNNGCCQR